MSMIGWMVSHYRVIEKLGSGGMALSTKPRTRGWADLSL